MTVEMPSALVGESVVLSGAVAGRLERLARIGAREVERQGRLGRLPADLHAALAEMAEAGRRFDLRVSVRSGSGRALSAEAEASCRHEEGTRVDVEGTATLLGVSARRVRQLAGDGVLVRSAGRPMTFDRQEVLALRATRETSR